jgi:ubiquinone/menaquinone biosynthesis C-methylase UbiE
MDLRDAYTTWSATYDVDRNLTRDLDRVVTVVTLSGVSAATILEIGCGTGKNTALLAQIGRRVCAVDFSEGMLSQARAKISTSNVIFAVGNITDPWICASQSIDLIVCNLVLEHIADLTFVFSEAFRVLARDGRFFVCELHPFRQYQGKKATFQRTHEQVEIPAFVHHLSDFLDAAERSGFALQRLKEWWHDEDRNDPPRLVSFVFRK